MRDRTIRHELFKSRYIARGQRAPCLNLRQLHNSSPREYDPAGFSEPAAKGLWLLAAEVLNGR